MKLSVIIVNYNVKYFLEQALRSVEKAIKGIDADVWVVDNVSRDGSVAMVKEKFPWVQVIANTENVGFSKANNQAMRISSGEYVLLLNPDTIVEEDTFTKCISFMDAHPEAGALGVKMIDGTGAFLPESKRSLPTPAVSFFKVFGFSALFPKSKIFGKYHLGFLDENETHEIEVLSGAFMFMRRTALDKVGLLDEDFFMYGEDIDLSYRIIKGGYKNYYFPETRIIHYKGESTKKGSLNYVKVFYQAMIIFARKHFSSQQASVYTGLIYIAIVIRALMTLLFSAAKRFALPLMDFTLSFAGLYLIKEFWENNIMHNDNYYRPIFTSVFIPAYILLWIINAYFSGAYDKPYRSNKVLRGVLIGTVLLAAIFGFLPNEYRFSRTIIVLGSLWTALAMLGGRVLYHVFTKGKAVLEESTAKRVVIVGSLIEGQRVLTLLNQALVQFQFLGFVSPAGDNRVEGFIGDIDMLDDLVEVMNLEEVIFCAKDLPSATIIASMARMGEKVEFKIVPEESLSIIGSNSKNSSGDLYAIDINLRINTAMARRNKRLFDMSFSSLVISLFPLFAILSGSLFGLLRNAFSVLFGLRSWVGYTPTEQSAYKLPALKSGVLYTFDQGENSKLDSMVIDRVNLFYARDYKVDSDMQIVWKNLRKLGR